MFVLPGISKQYTIILGNAVHKGLNAWVDPASAVYCFNTDAGDRAELPIVLWQTGSLASTRDAATVTFNAAALGSSVTPLPSGSPRQQLRRVRRPVLAKTPAALLHHVLSYCRQRSGQPPPPAVRRSLSRLLVLAWRRRCRQAKTTHRQRIPTHRACTVAPRRRRSVKHLQNCSPMGKWTSRT
jgi:hypothetical protein